MASIEEIKNNRKPVDRTSGFLCCGATEDILSLETKLYDGFGGWTITKDGATVEVPNQDGYDWENLTKLSEIEEQAKKEPDHEWLAIVFLPLSGATYKRSDCGNWVLIETNEGFA